jgi:hypothetical protein
MQCPGNTTCLVCLVVCQSVGVGHMCYGHCMHTSGQLAGNGGAVVWTWNPAF